MLHSCTHATENIQTNRPTITTPLEISFSLCCAHAHALKICQLDSAYASCKHLHEIIIIVRPSFTIKPSTSIKYGTSSQARYREATGKTPLAYCSQPCAGACPALCRSMPSRTARNKSFQPAWEPKYSETSAVVTIVWCRGSLTHLMRRQQPKRKP